MSDESFTISMADFIDGCNRAAAANPGQEELFQRQIEWGSNYSPFTPVTLTPDGTGQLIPSVALGGISGDAQTNELKMIGQGEPEVDLAALFNLADEYEITDSGAIETMLDYCARGGLDLVRRKLEESGLGGPAKNLRAAREKLRSILSR